MLRSNIASVSINDVVRSEASWLTGRGWTIGAMGVRPTPVLLLRFLACEKVRWGILGRWPGEGDVDSRISGLSSFFTKSSSIPSANTSSTRRMHSTTLLADLIVSPANLAAFSFLAFKCLVPRSSTSSLNWSILPNFPQCKLTEIYRWHPNTIYERDVLHSDIRSAKLRALTV